jgi:hypothetical protein
MCVREGRDERGRLLPGHTANLAGRPVRKPYLRLLEAAEAVGAQVVVMVPPRLMDRACERNGRLT